MKGKTILAGAGALLLSTAAIAQEYLPEWQEGCFDIHHIHTGKGESQLLVYPDGTTMLIDAGDMSGTGAGYTASKALPDASKTPAQWIARYVDHFSPRKGGIDYVMISHLHPDHMGSQAALHEGPNGYRICGVSELAEYLKFGKFVDRAYPEYDFPSVEIVETTTNGMVPEYKQFVSFYTRERGLRAEKFQIGSHKQFAPLSKGFDFDAWNIASNGSITTGHGRGTRKMYTQNPILFDENMLSNVMLFRYGPFKYYTGGDVSGNDLPASELPGKENAAALLGGEDLHRDFESQIADVVGACNVIKADHHAYKDCLNPYYLWKTAPDVIVFPVCEAAHPHFSSVDRILDEHYPGKRMMFATGDGGRAKLGEDRWAKLTAAGHVVIRVFDGGRKYQVFVLDAESLDYRLIYKSEILSSER